MQSKVRCSLTSCRTVSTDLHREVTGPVGVTRHRDIEHKAAAVLYNSSDFLRVQVGIAGETVAVRRAVWCRT